MKRLSQAACRALLADPDIIAALDPYDRRLYQCYLDGMPLEELARLTLNDIAALNKHLVKIKEKLHHFAKALAEIKPPTKPRRRRESKHKRVKSLRLRMQPPLMIRDVATFLKDPRIRKFIGADVAVFYEKYANGNFTQPELIQHVGVSDMIGVRVYIDHIESNILVEAMHHGLLKVKVESPIGESEARHEITEIQDREMAEKHMLTGDGRDNDEPESEKTRWKAGMSVINGKNIR